MKIVAKTASVLLGLATPSVALAAEEGGPIATGSWTSLEGILSNVGTFVIIGGGVLMLFGGIGIAQAIKDGQGMSMDSSVARLIGGAFMIAAGTGFKMIV